MYRFFIHDGIHSGQDILIPGDDYNHIKNVLRMKKGDEVLISDGQDREYLCSIKEFADDTVVLSIEDIMGQYDSVDFDEILRIRDELKPLRNKSFGGKWL